MNKPLKTYFNWSTGKDSALALYHLLRDPTYSIEHLLTSVNATHDRVSMHGLRRSLMEQQIAALDLPVTTIELPEEPGMAEYEQKMRAAVESLKANGFTTTAFGDIFLEDLRRYREEKLAEYNIQAVFPLWKKDTRALMEELIALGFRAIVVCADLRVLDESFAGREIDAAFLRDLPAGVDPCGENGEFHTFCFAGPLFKREIPFAIGEKVVRQYKSSHRFCFCDLTPV